MMNRWVLALAAISIASSANAADPPRPNVIKVKSKAELLLGKWRIVEVGWRQIPQDCNYTLELTDEGVFTLRLNDPKLRFRVKIGTYTLDGDTIRFTDRFISPPDAGGEPGKSWVVKIEALSESELAWGPKVPKKGEREEFGLVRLK